MRRHRRSRRKASLTERARCYPCLVLQHKVSRGVIARFFRLIIGGTSLSSSGESIANLFDLEDVVEDGCWFNALCTRVKPSHAIEFTVVSLDRNVAAIVALT